MSTHNLTLADLEQRFWARAKRRANDCWEWQGTRSTNGYGFVTIQQRKLGAHRAAWEFVHGEIPEGMFVCHSCDNKSCVNPAHLFLGTRQDNVDDARRKGLLTGPVAPPRGEKHHLTRVTEDDVREMRRRYVAGETQTSLAKEFGIGRSTAACIVTRKTWQHVRP